MCLRISYLYYLFTSVTLDVCKHVQMLAYIQTSLRIPAIAGYFTFSVECIKQHRIKWKMTINATRIVQIVLNICFTKAARPPQHLWLFIAYYKYNCIFYIKDET